MVAAVEPPPGLGSCGSACFSNAQPPFSRPAAASSHPSLGEVADGALARMLADALDAFDEPVSSAVGVRGTRELGSSVSTAYIASSQLSPGPSRGAGSGSGLQQRGSRALHGGSLRPGSRQPAPRRADSAPLGGGECTAAPPRRIHASSSSRIIPTSWRAGAHQQCSKPEPEPRQPSPAPEQTQRASKPEPAPQRPAPASEQTQLLGGAEPQGPELVG